MSRPVAPQRRLYLRSGSGFALKLMFIKGVVPMSSTGLVKLLDRFSGSSRGRQQRLRRATLRCSPRSKCALLSTITVANNNDSGSRSSCAALSSAFAGVGDANSRAPEGRHHKGGGVNPR